MAPIGRVSGSEAPERSGRHFPPAAGSLARFARGICGVVASFAPAWHATANGARRVSGLDAPGCHWFVSLVRFVVLRRWCVRVSFWLLVEEWVREFERDDTGSPYCVNVFELS